jgi:hypothetical protein
MLHAIYMKNIGPHKIITKRSKMAQLVKRGTSIANNNFQIHKELMHTRTQFCSGGLMMNAGKDTFMY